MHMFLMHSKMHVGMDYELLSVLFSEGTFIWLFYCHVTSYMSCDPNQIIQQRMRINLICNLC